VKVSHVAQWKGMELLWIIGEYQTLLIRMDSTLGPVAVPIGGEALNNNNTDNAIIRRWAGNDDNDDGSGADESDGVFRTVKVGNSTTFPGSTRSSSTTHPHNEQSSTTLLVNRFQILPIELGVAGSISPRLLGASDTGIDPPSSLLELYIDPDDTTTSDASSGPFDDDDAAAAANTPPLLCTIISHINTPTIIIINMSWCY